jgi:hypothetical protein
VKEEEVASQNIVLLFLGITPILLLRHVSSSSLADGYDIDEEEDDAVAAM